MRLIPIAGLLIAAGCKSAQNEIAVKPMKAATGEFLKCSPAVVFLSGMIEAESFPGPPNYKDTAKGDAPEQYWILKLKDPVDVDKDPGYPAPDENKPSLNVRDVQLVLDV